MGARPARAGERWGRQWEAGSKNGMVGGSEQVTPGLGINHYMGQWTGRVLHPNIVQGREHSSIIVVGVGGSGRVTRCGRKEGVVGKGVKQLEATGVGGGVISVRI